MITKLCVKHASSIKHGILASLKTAGALLLISNEEVFYLFFFFLNIIIMWKSSMKYERMQRLAIFSIN